MASQDPRDGRRQRNQDRATDLEEMDMTQLVQEPEQIAAAPVARPRHGLVFVPCAICRKPVDLAAVTDANDAPICGAHFVTEFPFADPEPARRYR
jgi:hypothetical protein